MSAVPQRPARGRLRRSARPSSRSRRGSSSRRRCRASSPRSCSAISRAVGETMIVLIAAGQTPELEPQPGRADPDDDRLHRRHREGRHPHRHDRATRRSSPSALTLFVLTLVMNMIAIRFVRKYRRGLRVSAAADRRDRWRRRRPRRDGDAQRPPARRGSGTLVFTGCCCSPASAIALVGLVALLVQVVRQGRRRAQPRLHHRTSPSIVPGQGRHRPGAHRARSG